jgi:hypothetical protein
MKEEGRRMKEDERERKKKRMTSMIVFLHPSSFFLLP